MDAPRVALACFLLTIPVSAHAPAAWPAATEHGHFITQSYCALCTDARTACVLKCNGAGTCIEHCDDDYQACVEQNCRYRR